MRTNVQKNKTYWNTDNNDPDVRHHMRQHINDRCFILASPLRRRQPLNCLRRRTERNGASGELRSFDAATNGGVREREVRWLRATRDPHNRVLQKSFPLVAKRRC